MLPVISLELIIAHSYQAKECRYEDKERENVANRTLLFMDHTMDQIISFSDYVYMDEATYDFIYHRYEDEVAYEISYIEFKKHSVFQFTDIITRMKKLTIFTNNPTVVSDSYVQKISGIQSMDWYKTYCDSGMNQIIYCGTKDKPEVSIITGLNYYADNNWFKPTDTFYKGVLKTDLDVVAVNTFLENMKVNQSIYVCYNDIVVFTNEEETFTFQSMEEVKKQLNIQKITTEKLPNYEAWKIYVVSTHNSTSKEILCHNRSILIVLLIDLIVPAYFISFIERSMIRRILLLENRFDWKINEEMEPIEGNYGKDEIGRLIEHYNGYVKRVDELGNKIQKRNEEYTALELSKKQAEINALVNQANPHFLYNSIESICMRSVIKQEFETATIMRHLSVLLREMSTWNTDRKSLFDELEFVRSYMEIQKYRFGEKIRYEVEMDQECESIIIPKLSVITFVENACVHGIENSLNDGIIKIQAKQEGTWYVIRIEDNGAGMSEEQKAKILHNVHNANLETFQNSTSTGILNAYLRLQLFYGENFDFDMESTEDQGTTVILRINVNGVV